MTLKFTSVLKAHGIAISMDGKGCWRDNALIERFWRTLKHLEVYSRAYECTSRGEGKSDPVLKLLQPYTRPHSALGGHTPDQLYFKFTNPVALAA